MPTISEIISKIKRYFDEGASNRTSENESGHNDDESDNDDDDDDDMEDVGEIDAPKAGTTIEDPPNGGLRAWLIVVSCSLINVILGIIEPFVYFSLLKPPEDLKKDLNQDDALDIYQVFLSIPSVYAPVASVSMATLGYEITIHIGSWCMAFSFLILSFIEDIHGVKFLLYVMSGVGSGMIQLGVLIPVLEYFTTKRIRALMITNISRYSGRFISAIIYATAFEDVSWQALFRICIGLSFAIGLVGLTVPSLKLKMKSNSRISFIARTLGMGQMKILKDATLWLVCFLFFVYQIAVEPPNAAFTDLDMLKRLEIRDYSNLTAYIFAPVIGLIAGAFLGWLFKFSADRKFFGFLKEIPTPEQLFMIILKVLALACLLMAVMCFIAPKATNFPYFFIFSILFSTQLALIEELRDESIPDVFGRQSVKFVESLLQFCIGIGGIIGSESSASLKWKGSFRMGGGMLFVTTAVSVIIILRSQIAGKCSRFNKLMAACGELEASEPTSECPTQSTSSRQPPDVMRDRRFGEMPNKRIKLKHKVSTGPSNIRFIVPVSHNMLGSHETQHRETEPSNNTNIHGNSTGHTVYTNIHNSASPVFLNVVQPNQLPNIYYTVQGPINPSAEYIVYSYNVMQNREGN